MSEKVTSHGNLELLVNNMKYQDCTEEREIFRIRSQRHERHVTPREKVGKEMVHLVAPMLREAWEIAKHLHKLHDKATFFPPSEMWSLPAPSSTKSEERQFCSINAHVEKERSELR